MSILVQCPNPSCAAVHKVKDKYAGKRCYCPICNSVLMVPDPSAPPASGSAKPAPETPTVSFQMAGDTLPPPKPRSGKAMPAALPLTEADIGLDDFGSDTIPALQAEELNDADVAEELDDADVVEEIAEDAEGDSVANRKDWGTLLFGFLALFLIGALVAGAQMNFVSVTATGIFATNADLSKLDPPTEVLMLFGYSPLAPLGVLLLLLLIAAIKPATVWRVLSLLTAHPTLLALGAIAGFWISLFLLIYTMSAGIGKELETIKQAAVAKRKTVEGEVSIGVGPAGYLTVGGSAGAMLALATVIRRLHKRKLFAMIALVLAIGAGTAVIVLVDPVGKAETNLKEFRLSVPR